MSSPTTAKMMVLTAVIVIVAMMVGQHQLRGGETNLTQSLFQTSLSRNSYGKFLQKGSFKSACPEIPTGSRKFLHKGLTAKPVLTGSEQAQFRTLNREETYGAVLELGMVCGGVSKASGVSQSVQEYACQCCPFSRVGATAYLHTPCERLTWSAIRQGM